MAQDWFKDAIFEEVSVRVYADSNGDGIGDLLRGEVWLSAASTTFPVVLEPYGYRWLQLG
jgi:hypothetical protein